MAKIGEKILQNRRKNQFPPKSQKNSGEKFSKIGKKSPKSEKTSEELSGNYPQTIRYPTFSDRLSETTIRYEASTPI